MRARPDGGGASLGVDVREQHHRDEPRRLQVGGEREGGRLVEAVVDVPAVLAADRLERARREPVRRRPRPRRRRGARTVADDRLAEDAAVLGGLEGDGAALQEALRVHVVGSEERGVEQLLHRRLERRELRAQRRVDRRGDVRAEVASCRLVRMPLPGNAPLRRGAPSERRRGLGREGLR